MADERTFNFTQRALEALEPPSEGRVTYHDTQVNGLSLRVSSTGRKTFQVRKRVKGKIRRQKLGVFPDMKIPRARKKAQAALGEIAEGVDPSAARKAERARSITLDEVMEEYLAARNLKSRTASEYRKAVKAVPKLKDQAVTAITRDDVSEAHAKLTRDSGPAWANLVFRVLRALFNYARIYEDEEGRSILPENPVDRLSQARTWNRVERRRTVIRPHQLPAWWKAVDALANPTARDYFRFLLLTGMRRSEAARLRWADVDLAGRLFVVRDTKNREPLELPLSDYLLTMLQDRHQEAEGEYVFPSRTGGPLHEPKKWVDQVRKESEVDFRLHDLRRTFSTVAEGLDIPAYALKRLLNHTPQDADVTAGYVVIDVERLREPMQRITDFMLKAAKVRPGAEVVELPDRTSEDGN